MNISELIYETCKTYLSTQGKFLMLLDLFIAVIIVFYFGFLRDFDCSFQIVIHSFQEASIQLNSLQ